MFYIFVLFNQSNVDTVSYGCTKLETPVPVRTLNLSNLGHSTWMDDHSRVLDDMDVDAVPTNTVKSQKRRYGASIICLGQKTKSVRVNILYIRSF